MANVTVNSFALSLAAEFGISSSDSAAIAQIERFVNDGIKHILNYAAWPWRNTYESIAATTSPIALAVSACEVRAIRIPSLDVYLDHKTENEMANSALDLEQTGQPSIWYDKGYDTTTLKMQIGLWPVPSASTTLTVYETLLAVDLSSASSIPFPEDVRACLREICRYYMEKVDGNLQAAGYSKVDFIDSLRRLSTKYIELPTTVTYTDVPNARPRGSFLGGKYPF